MNTIVVPQEKKLTVVYMVGGKVLKEIDVNRREQSVEFAAIWLFVLLSYSATADRPYGGAIQATNS